MKKVRIFRAWFSHFLINDKFDSIFFFLPCRARHDSSDGRSRLHTSAKFKRNKRSRPWGKQTKQATKQQNATPKPNKKPQTRQPAKPSPKIEITQVNDKFDSIQGKAKNRHYSATSIQEKDVPYHVGVARVFEVDGTDVPFAFDEKNCLSKSMAGAQAGSKKLRIQRKQVSQLFPAIRTRFLRSFFHSSIPSVFIKVTFSHFVPKHRFQKTRLFVQPVN